MTTAGTDAGWRAWRMRVDSPGVWPIHCHCESFCIFSLFVLWLADDHVLALQHMIMGMQTVWVFGDAADIRALPAPNLAGYLTYGDDITATVNHTPSY